MIFFLFLVVVLTTQAHGDSTAGLFPSVFNLAESAAIIANATCGDKSTEVYCQLDVQGSIAPSNQDCGICDATEPAKTHPIGMAVDGRPETWWQAPSLQFGPDYHFVTVTVDLKRVFQVGYILLQAAKSPRPGNWILERSLDGVEWAPWQFFAITDEECWHAFGVEPRRGKPSYRYDDEVICTSYFSKLEPLSDGEIHISLVNGRPGASGPSRTLTEFTLARYVRLRFRRLRILANDQLLVDGFHFPDAAVLRRYFYSLRDITIGGQCPCNGHANECAVNPLTMDYNCKCQHNTCGAHCDKCCPMYNQKLWRPGKFITANSCERCQCFGHAEECFFDPQVEAERRSLNTEGKLEGGGVCLGCRHHTKGINCEHCEEGYFRPLDVSQFDSRPCRPCRCSNLRGSIGTCYNNVDAEKLAQKGVKPGDCVCKEGFAGPRCDQCATGYHNYPRCEPCPCTLAGTLNGACSGLCQCKANVEGRRCDRCKRGFFAMHEAHAEGCLECFCNGVTDQCESASLGVEVLQHAEGWKVSDLRGRLVTEPYWSTVTHGVTVAEEDMRGLETYYWQAPQEYIGNRLVAYGLKISISTSWHTGRGDTAGTATLGPDVILEGANGMLIGCGSLRYVGQVNASISVILKEHEWYHIPPTLFDIEAKSYLDEKPDFKGRSVSKAEFMQVIESLNRLLIRAKYHTDQLEGTLHTAAMEFGSQQSLNLRKTIAVERCLCPQGYEGLSCENCQYGFTRRNNTLYEGECVECQCNGHAAHCDAFSLRCGTCEHNTEGQQCEKCVAGYYGNPLRGTPGDCKPCKCPLEIPSNNFSPTCRQATLDYDRYSIAPEGYVCDACPRGYAGPHCERCDNGYFGNPLKIGDYCKPCHCNGNANIYVPNWCDHRTGQCLQCLGNTAGWHCENCLKGFFGNPLSGQCKPCDCNPYGSRSEDCDPVTGQCQCKDKYVGRTCSQCKDGFGNVAAGCRLCGCNTVGSRSDVCDADSGQCDCHSGVEGNTCDKCKPLHYGFNASPEGCLLCKCHPKGSLEPQCHEETGQCLCASRVTGQRCDACVHGFWNINSGVGCDKCHCDPMGSYDGDCDDVSGQCRCKPGVGGLDCSICLPGFWGYSPTGCTKCFPCEDPGHICDPDTGRCICPALTVGSACQNCAPGTWSYHPYKGCQYCACHPKGSVSEQCDLETGACRCLEGFEGEKCDQCSQGHYNFPHCWPCNCNINGTESTACYEGDSCSCDLSGDCQCKSLVEGKKCASCRPGTFALSKENPEGCLRCFCSGRTQDCHQADFVWSQISSFDTKRTLTITRGDTSLDVSEGLPVIPGDKGDVVIGVQRVFSTPLYWSLPSVFLGDKTMSYNGFLRFSITCNGQGPTPADETPLVQIQAANQRIVLEHYPHKVSSSGRYEVRLDENAWVEKGTRKPISRQKLMVALLKLERILVRATDFTSATIAELRGATMDLAVIPQESDRRPLALGVEICRCPPKYSGASCQDPGTGYYRWQTEYHFTTTTYMDFVGTVKSCQCNGRADECHPETGNCQGCRENTTGTACELCAGGFYGDPLRGESCKPCQCPNAEHNHAATCSVDSLGQFMCQCQEGYTGPKCDQCDYGYFGNAVTGCLPCECNELGSVSDQCHQTTGQCFCVRGVSGRDCSQCQPRHILVQGGVCRSCDYACVGPLLDTMDNIADYFRNANVSDIDPAPMLRLKKYQRQVAEFNETSLLVKETKQEILLETGKLLAIRPHAELTMLEVKKYEKAAADQRQEANVLLQQSGSLQSNAGSLKQDVEGILARLQIYGVNNPPHVSINRALSEARQILGLLKGRNYAEADILARKELSYARQSLNAIRDHLFDRNKLESEAKKLENVEAAINDLLQFLNTAMDHTREAMLANQKHHDLYVKAHTGCSSTSQMITESRDMFERNAKLVTDGQRMNVKASESFERLAKVFQKLSHFADDLQGKESKLSNVVNDYRSRYVEPCQKHVRTLLASADQVLSLFGPDRGVGAERTLEAANAYQRIIKIVLQAGRAAEEAFTMSIRLLDRIGRKNDDGYDLFAQADVGRVKSRDLRQEAEGLRQNSREMQVQIEELILRWQSYILMMSKRKDDLLSVERELDRLQIVSVLAEDAVRHSEEALRQAIDVHASVSKVFDRITLELRSHVKEMQSFSPEELGNIPRKLTEARRHLQQVDKQATYLSHRKIDIDEVSRRLGSQISDLKSKIAMARHAAESVKISITNQRVEHPEATSWGCSRSYRVNLTSSLSTTISLVYAITDAEEKNGLLVYLPSGEPLPDEVPDDTRDFMALEMVDRKIRFLWNNGAGTMSIMHNTTITPSTDSHHGLKWYRITAERVGNIGRLNVRLVKPLYVGLEDNKWVVGESPPNAHVLNLHRQDLLYVGGGAIPDELKSTELTLPGTFSGILYHLEVDGRLIGLWNFVTSAGCRETHSGILQETHGTCYSFRGDGYAVQREIRHYDPRYLSLSLEFKTFDSNALLFYAINEFTRQHILLELRDGRLYMELHYGPEKQLAFLTSNTYNGGGWVQAEVARALRNNVETGVLRVTLNGIREDLMDTVALPPGVVFQMKDCLMFFGGLPPTYVKMATNGQVNQRPWNNFLGQMRAITISNPGSNSLINPLYTQRFKANPYFGVKPDCDRQPLKAASFNGEAYIEVRSQSLRNECTMGFAFQTFTTNGVLLVSNLDGDDYYSISLVDGRLFFKFATHSVPVTVTSDSAYNDGRHHTVSLTRSRGRLHIYVDDNLITESNGILFPTSNDRVLADQQQSRGGLYIGGLPFILRDRVEKASVVGSINGFVGTISDITFIDDLSIRVVDLNQPITIERAQVGHLMHFPNVDWVMESTITLQQIRHRPTSDQAQQADDHADTCHNAAAVERGDSPHTKLGFVAPKRRRLHIKFQMLSRSPGLIVSLPIAVGRRRDKRMVALWLKNSDLHLEILDYFGQVRSSTKAGIARTMVDGWTEVEIHIDQLEALLTINKQVRGSVTLPRKLRVEGLVSFGNPPKEYREIVAKDSFEGCISNVKLNGLPQDLVNNSFQRCPICV